MSRVASGWCSALLAVLGLVFTSLAGPRSHGEVLVAEMVSVTGTLHAVEDPDASDRALEIDSDLGGRYRIDERGRGAALRGYVGKVVTIVAFVEPYTRNGRSLLRVERFRLYEG